MASIQAPKRSADVTRRIRDLLRAEIIAESFPQGVLPSEEALRAEFNAPRACVRDALTLLQEEGLLTRVRGQGTFVSNGRVRQSLEEAHGVTGHADDSIWHGRMTARVIDWSDVPATPPVARMLRIEVGTTVLRIDYTAHLDDLVIGQASNHLTYPEAERLRPEMMRVDLYAMLRHGGIELGESSVLLDAGVADAYDAELLGVEVGEPLVIMEQTIFAPDGRPIDAAFVRGAATRSTYFSRSTSSAQRGEP